MAEALLATQDADGYIGQFIREPDRDPLYADFTWEDASLIASALANDYRYFGTEVSRDGAKALIRCMAEAHRKSSSAVSGVSGLAYFEAALEVYRITGDRKFLLAARNTKLGPVRSIAVAAPSDWDDVLFQHGWHDVRKEVGKPRTEQAAG